MGILFHSRVQSGRARTAGRLAMLFAAGLMLAACGGGTVAPAIGVESQAVNTPTYRADRIFFLEAKSSRIPAAARLNAEQSGDTGAGALADAFRNDDLFFQLVNPLVRSQRIREQGAENTEYAVQNGEPLAIMINSAYLPSTRRDEGRTRDVAVLVELGQQTGENAFLAIDYLRDVPYSGEITFSDLPVKVIDAWNSQFPPKFVVRLVDVTAARGSADSQWLTLAAQVNSSVVSLAGTPSADIDVDVARRAATLVLNNPRNKSLVDYEFFFYPRSQAQQSGGAPLAVFTKGSMMVVAQPETDQQGRPADESFWGKYSLQYSTRNKRLEYDDGPGRRGDAVGTPYIIASVLTASAVLPPSVKQRSAFIANQMRNANVTAEANISELKEEVDQLASTVALLDMRETYFKAPSKSGFARFIKASRKATDEDGNLTKVERNFVLFTVRNITPVFRDSLETYQSWWSSCAEYFTVDLATGQVEMTGETDSSLPTKCR